MKKELALRIRGIAEQLCLFVLFTMSCSLALFLFGGLYAGVLGSFMATT
jgi:hypothetical protein